MLLWVFLGCSDYQDSGELSCDDAAAVNYYNFGDAFLRHNCQGCHASTAENRYGAPPTVTFDTVDQAWEWKDRILTTTLGASANMPPAGSITEDESVLLYWWLECGKEGR